MTKRPKKIVPAAITGEFVRAICDDLRANKPIRVDLPVWGRIHIDRQLPFLAVYRRNPDFPAEGTERLVMGEASYLQAPGDPKFQRGLSRLIFEAAGILGDIFGACLVLEIWAAAPSPEGAQRETITPPEFRIVTAGAPELEPTIEALQAALLKTRVRRRNARVEAAVGKEIAPAGMTAILRRARLRESRIHLAGIEVKPVFRGPEGQFYPIVLRDMHRGFSRALKQGVFHFARTLTTHRPPHYQSLGRHAMVKAVRDVDHALAEISSLFDFLLLVTPVNAAPAWNAFRRNRFEKAPRFRYRPISIAPGLIKRELYSAPIERIEDPEIAWLFRQKQDEIDRQLTALLDRDTARFRYASQQIFGGHDVELLRLAETILGEVPPHSRESAGQDRVDAAAFVGRAREELDYFRKSYSGALPAIEVRNDINGLMVSKGNLLVPAELSIPRSRIEALVQHEVGTHVLTYLNGRAQPFRQLYAGLAGYDELQEGIAVLSEYLVGGLSAPRLRLLAARVVAVSRMLQGATFVDTFRELDRIYEFSQTTAFTVTMRVYRGGGLTKDASYLRGLVRLIRYLQNGGELEPLFVGKIGADHVPLVEELLRREVLRKPPLRPRYLSDPAAAERLRRISKQGSVLDLIMKRRK